MFNFLKIENYTSSSRRGEALGGRFEGKKCAEGVETLQHKLLHF
jgi:hypothetical protein